MAGELGHHSDVGSQYTLIRLMERLDREQIATSIGSVDDAYDNLRVKSGQSPQPNECIFTMIFDDGA